MVTLQVLLRSDLCGEPLEVSGRARENKQLKDHGFDPQPKPRLIWSTDLLIMVLSLHNIDIRGYIDSSLAQPACLVLVE
jgi:hypothetical protein